MGVGDVARRAVLSIMPSLTLFAAAAAVFVSHAAPSWPGVREDLRRRFGSAGFAALHGVGSTAALAGLIAAYRVEEDRSALFEPLVWAAGSAVVVTPIAFALIALRLACPPGALTRPNPPAGIYRLTRAPGALGTLLWALAHVQATGDGPRVVLFGSFALIAAFSLAKNHYALKTAGTPEAERFLRETALFPGWALADGRQKLVAAEWLGFRPFCGVAVGLTVWAATLFWLHPRLFGVDPWILAGF